jgi:ribosomal protection tetracycline resistance protein
LHTLNLGILAHVDAGKTSLTERLLFEAGAIGDLGSVDDGTTRTDSMDIELRRLAVPTLIFINKIDRGGADPGRVIGEISRRLAASHGARLLPVSDVQLPGGGGAGAVPVAMTDRG